MYFTTSIGEIRLSRLALVSICFSYTFGNSPFNCDMAFLPVMLLSVEIIPGHIALIVILSFEYCLAQLWVTEFNALLLALYICKYGVASLADIEEIFITRP